MKPIEIKYIDDVTLLKNRSCLLKDLANGKDRILFFLNIDNFSEINCIYGEEIGNIVLLSIAFNLKDTFSINNIYRIGNDEFVVLFDYTKDNFERLILRIKNFTEELIVKGIKTDKLEEQIFISLTSSVSYGERDLLTKAQIAFKVARKNNSYFEIYKIRFEELRNKAINLNLQINKYKEAIRLGKIIAYYQPIIRNSDKKIVKYEALARLSYNEEIISPIHFIELDKKNKAI